MDRPLTGMGSPDWDKYVMSLFEKGEVTQDGNPFIFGLRRVAHIVLGDITRCDCHVVQMPQLASTGMLSVTVAECHLEWKQGDVLYSVTEAADVHYNNTDAKFARFPSAMACTRAEGRAYRKAMRIRKAAAEELTSVELEDFDGEKPILKLQIGFIRSMCNDMKIDLSKFLQAGKEKYNAVEDLSQSKALEMIEYLSELRNDPKKIPSKLLK